MTIRSRSTVLAVVLVLSGIGRCLFLASGSGSGLSLIVTGGGVLGGSWVLSGRAGGRSTLGGLTLSSEGGTGGEEICSICLDVYDNPVQL